MSTIPRISVLDIVPIGPGVSAGEALSWTTQVAQKAEILGYYRFWVAEHHGIADIGSSAPSVLIAHLAANTATLRIGAGGVMLPNHAPLIIAEQFSLLHALHPGRIDLGIGRAKGANAVAALALARGLTSINSDSFPEQLDELTHFLNGSFSAGHRYEKVNVSPHVDPPPIYLLGSSKASAEIAAARGLPFAFAHHLAPNETVSALSAYRAAFKPSKALKDPYAIVTVLVVCAADQEDAERAAIAAAAVRVRRSFASQEGRATAFDELTSPVVTEEEAWLIAEKLAAGGALIGNPVRVRGAMLELCRSCGANELMLSALEYNGPARIRTLTAVAHALALGTAEV